MYFDYEKFEKELLMAVEEYAKSLLGKKEDFYILSVDYWPFRETFVVLRGNTNSYLNTKSEPSGKDYMYYKYSEQEWDGNLIKDLKELSENLREHYNELDKTYSEELRHELQYAHAIRIIEACKNVLKKFRTTDTYKSFPTLNLNFYIKGYYNKEERNNIFAEINERIFF